MEFNLNYRSDKSGGGKFRFSGNPLVLPIGAFLLLLFFLMAKGLLCITWDAYASYEGKVVKIEERWSDIIVREFTVWEHLIIETPEGETIDKYVSAMSRVINNIKVGDYVVKIEGFGNQVRPRDKKTSTEMLEDAKRLLRELDSKR